MAQIVIDTDTIWKSLKIPLAIAGILVLIILAAMAGYDAGKGSRADVSFNVTANPGYTIQNIIVDDVAFAPGSVYTFSGQTPNHTIRVTVGNLFCSRLTFTDNDFRSSDVRYFHNGNVIPAGTYTLDVSGWNSRWLEDKGWHEEGATQWKSAVYDDITNLQMGETSIPLSKIVNGTFDHENSKGSAVVTLSYPSQVGIVIDDDTYPDNRGYAVFELKNSRDAFCVLP